MWLLENGRNVEHGTHKKIIAKLGYTSMLDHYLVVYEN